MKIKYRYEFSKVVKEGKPCLRLIDNYLAPLVINHYDFEFENTPELYGYGSEILDLILDIISGVSKEKNISFIVMRDSMSRVKQAIEEVGEAMEAYDHATGSKSEFAFKSTAIDGQAYTSNFKNSD